MYFSLISRGLVQHFRVPWCTPSLLADNSAVETLRRGIVHANIFGGLIHRGVLHGGIHSVFYKHVNEFVGYK